MNEILQAMMDADLALYEKILDTPGFAFHFERLCKLAKQGETNGGGSRDLPPEVME